MTKKIDNVTPLKRKEKPQPKYDTDALIFDSFSASDPDMDNNIGRIVIYQKGTPRERLVQIVGVQKLWDHDENGVYRFGVLGYTVKEAQESFVLNGEVIPLGKSMFACSKKELTF